MKRFLTILIFVFFAFVNYIHTQILPFTEPDFNFEQFNWYMIPMDSTDVDSIKKDGRNDIFDWHKIPILEKETSLFFLNTKTMGGVEGGLLSRCDKETGKLVWSFPFDLRTNELHEYPYTQYFGHDGWLHVVSYQAKEIQPDNLPIFNFTKPDSYWKIRKFNPDTGELIETILLNKEELTIKPYVYASFFYKIPSGYMMLNRSIDFKIDKYYIKKFNNEYELVSVDTATLNLPSIDYHTYFPFVRQYKEGFTTFDAKLGTKEKPRYYNVNMWDNEFNWLDSISESKIIAILDTQPTRYLVEYADKDKFIVKVRYQYDNKKQFGYLISNKGELLEEFQLYESEGINNSSYNIIVMGENMECPVVTRLDEADKIWTHMYSVCDSLNKNITFAPNGKNVVTLLKFSHVLENGNIILQSGFLKDTMLDNPGRFQPQGEIYVNIDGSVLGTSVDNDGVEWHAREPLIVYPNPTEDLLSCSESIQVEKAAIYDFNGQLVLTIANSNTIDVSGLHAGLYFLRVKTKNAEIYTSKFIKL